MKNKGRKEWEKFRRNYLKTRKNWKDEWDCELCGKSTAYPEVDHVVKRSVRPGSKYDDDNLQILCEGMFGCHAKETAKKP